MTLEEKVNNDLKAAMKAKDQPALRGLRAIKAAILLFQTSGTGESLDRENELKILQKLVKQRKESLDIYVRQNRNDLAQTEREEIAVIERYLPEQMDAGAISEVVEKILRETGATSMQDMGKVMQHAMRELAGKADGKTISAIVREKLTT